MGSFMPLKKPLFLAILNMDNSKKFPQIETDIKNTSEITDINLFRQHWLCALNIALEFLKNGIDRASKTRKRLASINVAFFPFHHGSLFSKVDIL